MKILIVIGNNGLEGKRTGVGNYHDSLLRAIKTRYSLVLTKEPDRRAPENAEIIYLHGIKKILYRYFRFFIPIELFFGIYDIIVSDNWIPPKIFRKTRRMCIVHDLMAHIYPHYYTFTQRVVSQLYFRRLRFADRIITVSESTKSNLSLLLGLNTKKISVIPPTCPEKKEKTKAVNTAYERSLLFIGDLRKNKNILRMIQGFERYREKSSDFSMKFLVVGQRSFEYKDLKRYVDGRGLNDVVCFLGYISDEKKVELLESCLCLMFVSEYEGFGIPVLEAFRYGLPVLTSSSSSLKEFGRESTLQVDPLNIDEIAKGIKDIQVPFTRESLIANGYHRIEDFCFGNYEKKIVTAMQMTMEIFKVN